MKNRNELSNFGFELRVVDELRKISRSLHKLAEHDCNYGLTGRQETRETNLIKKASDLAESIGYRIFYQGDPRGCSLYLLSEDIKNNEYSSGIALY